MFPCAMLFPPFLMDFVLKKFISFEFSIQSYVRDLSVCIDSFQNFQFFFNVQLSSR